MRKESKAMMDASMKRTDSLIKALNDEIHNLQAQCAAYRRILKGQEQLLLIFRTKDRSPESAFELILSGQRALKQLGTDDA